MRKLMWFTIGFGAACALGTYVWLGKWALLIAVAGIAVGVAVGWLRNREFVRRGRAACIGLVLGILWTFVYDLGYIQPLRELDGQTVPLELTTVTYSWDTDYASAVDCYLDMDGKRYTVRVYLNNKQSLEPWTHLELTGLVRLTTDGGYAEPTFHRSNGILALCYQKGDAVISAEQASAEGYLVSFVQDIRRNSSGIIEAAFPTDAAGFAKALLMGDRTDIGYDMSTDFKVSGISHIIAVSGLHMSILFALLNLLTFRRRYILALAGIPAIVLFMAVSGFTPSVTRSGIMLILTILSMCVDREYDPPTALSFSVLVMLIGNPLVASSVGFQLSVGSVAGIFLFYDRIHRWILLRIPEKKNKIFRQLRHWFSSGVSITLAAQTITMPLTAIYYGTVSMIGVVTNLAVLWVIGFIFYGVMAVCLLGLASAAAAGAAAWVVAWPIRLVTGTAHVLASVPLAAVYTDSVYLTIWLVMCCVLILTLIFSKNKRPVLCGYIAALGLCAALALSWVEPMLWEHHVTVLDVGQGQCVILQGGGKTFVVDCGGDYADDAADRCAEKLLSMGIVRIDGLILSHYDADHCGGAAYLLQRVGCDTLYLPADHNGDAQEILEAFDEQVIWVTQDLQLAAHDMKITLFAPQNAVSDNESSIAVLFQTEKCDTLITGDMSCLREKLLLRRTQLPQLELLIVGHHGSSGSTSSELLAATSPKAAIISVGKDNRYNHPSADVLARLQAAGCAIYRTDEMGDITYRR